MCPGKHKRANAKKDKERRVKANPNNHRANREFFGRVGQIVGPPSDPAATGSDTALWSTCLHRRLLHWSRRTSVKSATIINYPARCLPTDTTTARSTGKGCWRCCRTREGSSQRRRVASLQKTQPAAGFVEPALMWALSGWLYRARLCLPALWWCQAAEEVELGQHDGRVKHGGCGE